MAKQKNPKRPKAEKAPAGKTAELQKTMEGLRARYEGKRSPITYNMVEAMKLMTKQERTRFGRLIDRFRLKRWNEIWPKIKDGSPRERERALVASLKGPTGKE